MALVCSPHIAAYLENLDKSTKELYKIAQKAREQNLDPEPFVDIPLAVSVAQKVEALVSSVAPQLKNSGLSTEIEALEKKYSPGDWRVALEIAKEVAQQKFCTFKDLREALETGIRVGFAYVTMGSVSAPLEGFVELRLKKRLVDGKDYMALYFAGPIRGAGGTAEAVCILIADYLRKVFNIAEYDITDEEVKRYQVELDDYMSKVAHRQYKPTAEEIEFIVRNIKVELNGDPTEPYEVSQCRRLPRVETDTIRGGMCLVLTEGPPLKAEKLWKQLQKWGKDFGLEDWAWLKTFIELKTKLHSGGAKEEKLAPVDSYLSDIVAGRPVLSYPLRSGGFRLRYGRTRLTGLAATAIHPATMAVLNDYIAIGTQVKTERPGKATVFTPCDSIEGPIVKLQDGSVLKLTSYAEAKSLRQQIIEILYLGDILISYGDFSEMGQRLAPAGYCEEWWSLEVEKATGNRAPELVTAKAAIDFALQTKTPLHPKWTYFWREISTEQFNLLKEWMQKLSNCRLPLENNAKRVLELIGCPHHVVGNDVVLDADIAKIMEFLLKGQVGNVEGKNGLECINKISPIIIRDKSGTFIGTRMGRPEKAKLRVLRGAPATLFPIGKEGGRFRSLNEALEQKEIFIEVPIFVCSNCNRTTIYPSCENCGQKTEAWRVCPLCKKKTKKAKCHTNTIGYEKRSINISYYVEKALQRLQMIELPQLVKGVKGTWNKDRIVEYLAKGILRAKHK
ncbi:MAG: DNA polymerase II large subunit, partial [Candidatus Nanoarchaeia archaeon]